MSIRDRAERIINLKQFSQKNAPEKVSLQSDVVCPYDEQKVLRCVIKVQFGEYIVPENLEWVRPLLEEAIRYQEKEIGIKHSFCYITVRHGVVDTKTDDEWHVDGFSQTITHIPEQNYIWTDKDPTEYVDIPFYFPEDFDSSKHNIHYFFQDNIDEDTQIKKMEAKTLYCCDPYVVHRRPKDTFGEKRTFIRISFCPIEIIDSNNTINPELIRETNRDGVKDFRDNLIRYKK